MGELLKNTRSNTIYLRRYVKVVEKWECGWKKKRIETDAKRFIDDEFPCRPKWKMTQKQIIAAAVDGSLFGAIVCDIRVPSELRAHFAEMQPIYKNTMVTRDDIGPSMQQYAIDHDIMSSEGSTTRPFVTLQNQMSRAQHKSYISQQPVNASKSSTFVQ